MNIRIPNNAKLNQLEKLKQNYLKNKTVDNKIAMLLKEREIIYQELEYPHLTAKRNFEAIQDLIDEELVTSAKELKEMINVLNIHALSRLEGSLLRVFLKKLDIKKYKKALPFKKIYSLLEKVHKNTHSENDFVNSVMSNICGYYTNCIGLTTKKINNKFDSLNKKIWAKNKPDIITKKISRLENYIDQHSYSDVKAAKRMNKLLCSDNISKGERQLVILGAGKFKSDKNFDILKNIALDKSEQSPIMRQNAIQSLALYLRKKPDEVKDILTQIKNEDSIFSPLGRILYDKITGNYHRQKNRELKYHNLTNIPKARKHISKIVKIDTHLNMQKQNVVDLSILPFINIFNNKKLTITDDTITKYLPKSIGKRYFYSEDYPNIGDYKDSVEGCATYKQTILNIIRVSSHENAISHEMGHALNFLFDYKDESKLEKLYNNALKQNKCLDYYAKTNYREYFAQGCEAYNSFYKPHKHLLSSIYSPISHTHYELLEKDPDLYKFIKKVYKKYEQNM